MHRAFSGTDKVTVTGGKISNGADLCQTFSVLIDCVAGKVYPVVPVHAGTALIKLYVPVQPLGLFQAVIVRECIHIIVQQKLAEKPIVKERKKKSPAIFYKFQRPVLQCKSSYKT